MSVQRSRRASRPTTPLRRSVSRPGNSISLSEAALPLEAFKPALSELSDSLADLDTNFQYLDIMHENLSRFSESFAAFLYGLEVNAWCVDFQEAPTTSSFDRFYEHQLMMNQADAELQSKDHDETTTTQEEIINALPEKKPAKSNIKRPTTSSTRKGVKPGANRTAALQSGARTTKSTFR